MDAVRESQSGNQRRRVIRCLVGVLLSGFVIVVAILFLKSPLTGMSSLAAPRLTVSTTRLDLGDGKANEILRGSLLLRNDGGTPLEFSITKSCGCTELTPSTGTVSPGGSANIAVGIKLDGHTNTERSVMVSINSNDPKQSVVNCTARARCPAPFEVAPAFLDFGKVAPNKVASLSAGINVKLVDSERRTLRAQIGGSSFVASIEAPGIVRVKPIDALAFGNHYDVLELFLDGSSERLVRVPLQVEVSPPLSAIPSTLILRENSVGEFRPIHWIVVGHDDSIPLGELIAVDAPPEFRIENVGRIDEHRCRYRLTIEAGWDAPQRSVLTLDDSSTERSCKLLLISGKK